MKANTSLRTRPKSREASKDTATPNLQANTNPRTRPETTEASKDAATPNLHTNHQFSNIPKDLLHHQHRLPPRKNTTGPGQPTCSETKETRKRQTPANKTQNHQQKADQHSRHQNKQTTQHNTMRETETLTVKPRKALRQKRHTPKHEINGNSGPRPLQKTQRWPLPPEPSMVLPKKPSQPRKSQLNTSTEKNYTEATLTPIHKTSKKDQLWEPRPGNHQIQRKCTCTCTSTDKTANASPKDKKYLQTQRHPKYKEGRFLNSNHHSLSLKSLASLPPYKLCYCPLLPPNSHSRHFTIEIASTSTETYTLSQHPAIPTQLVLAHLLQFQQIVRACSANFLAIAYFD